MVYFGESHKPLQIEIHDKKLELVQPDVVLPSLDLGSHPGQSVDGDAECTKFSELLLQNPSFDVVKLIIRASNVTSDGLRAMIPHFRMLSKLRHLDLSGNAIGPEGAAVLKEMYRPLNEQQIAIVMKTPSKHPDFTEDQLLMEDYFWYWKEQVWSFERMEKERLARLKSRPTLLNLTSLNLSSCNLGDEGLALVFRDVVVGNVNLQELVVARNQISDVGCNLITDFIAPDGSNVSLKRLDLSFNMISSFGAQYVVDLLHNARLSQIDLKGNDLGPEGGRAIGHALSNVSSIHLGSNSLGSLGLNGICDGLMVCGGSRLTEVDLSWNHFDDDAVANISCLLHNSVPLVKLSLLGNSITSVGIEGMIVPLRKSIALEVLDLGDNCLGDDGGLYIAQLISSSTMLKSLSVAGNGLGDKTAIEIAQVLPNNQCLETLNLSGNDISGKGVEALAEIEQCNNLTNLFLFGNPVDALSLTEVTIGFLNLNIETGLK